MNKSRLTIQTHREFITEKSDIRNIHMINPQ